MLNDKIALVTGSTHNIGLAIARAFAREGAKVIVHSRHEDDAKKIAREINGDYFVADMAKPEQIVALFIARLVSATAALSANYDDSKAALLGDAKHRCRGLSKRSIFQSGRREVRL